MINRLYILEGINNTYPPNRLHIKAAYKLLSGWQHMEAINRCHEYESHLVTVLLAWKILAVLLTPSVGAQQQTAWHPITEPHIDTTAAAIDRTVSKTSIVRAESCTFSFKLQLSVDWWHRYGYQTTAVAISTRSFDNAMKGLSMQYVYY